MPIEFKRAIPMVRIFSLEKAKEFYLDFLGFALDWEHRFEEGTPVYMQISRGDLRLHLTEHYGDCCPGSNVFVEMTGIDEFHREISAKNHEHMRPGVERTFFNSKEMVVIDPFGNRIRFNEFVAGAA
jgi:catechol 2,3-dioxygenase-like lactoylglutathione lyase family enzyme